MKLLILTLILLLLGCATLKPDCQAVCVEDTCIHYCETQERVTRRCAKNAFKSDTGDVWRDDGTFIDKDGKLNYIAACTEYYPTHKYPFHIWVWKVEAWRISHEACHIYVYLRHGSFADHQATCHDFGLNRGKKRLSND